MFRFSTRGSDVKTVKIMMLLVVGLSLSLTGCQTNNSFLKSLKASAMKKKAVPPQPSVDLGRWLQDAEELYQEGQYELALKVYQKILMHDAENSKALFRIEEIKKWTQLLNEKEKSYRKALSDEQQKTSKQMEETRKQGEELQSRYLKEEASRKEAGKKLEVAKALYKAGLSLSDHRFDEARTWTRKALMGNPDSLAAKNLWGRIAGEEEKWVRLEKLRKTEEKKAQKEERGPSSVKNTPPPVSKEEAAKEASLDEMLHRKTEDMIQRHSQSSVEEVVGREFLFDKLPDQKIQQAGKMVEPKKELKTEFLQEQYLILYKKAIGEYERELREGTSSGYDGKGYRDEKGDKGERELSHYQEGIAEAYFTLGEYYENQKKWDEAVSHYGRLLEQFSTSAYAEKASFHLGLVAEAQGKHQEAYAAFDNLVSAFPKSDMAVEAFLKMAEILRAQKKFKEALRVYGNLKVQHPEDKPLLQNLDLLAADTHGDHGEDEEALERYTKILQQGRAHTKFEKAEYQKAAVLVHMKKFDEARAGLSRILEGDPLNRMKPEASALYGKSCFEEGDYSKAVIFMKKTLETYPEFPGKDFLLLTLGKAYENLGVMESALEAFQKLCDYFPDSGNVPEVLFEMAKILTDQSHFGEALKKLDELKKGPAEGEFVKRGRYLLGDILFKEEKYEAAEKQFRAASLSDSAGVNAWSTWLKIAKCLRKLRKTELVKMILKDTILSLEELRENWKQKAPPSQEQEEEQKEWTKIFYKLLFEQGDFLLEQKEYDGAVGALSRVGSEYPEGEDVTWSQYLTGKAYELSGKRDQAIEQYQKMVDASGEGYWVEQAKFNLKHLQFDRDLKTQAVEIGGRYSEGIRNQ